MKPGYRAGKVSSNIRLINNIYELTIELPDTSKLGNPGQFYMLKYWDRDPFLPRPISIANVENGRLIFLYEIKGKGTEIFSKLKSGDILQLLGPLGNGFKLEDEIEKELFNIAIVSGGIGIAPMIYLVKKLQGRIDFYCGFRDEVYCIETVKKYVDNVYISTESGSVGHKGFITELLQCEKYDMIYTCGPEPMMEIIVDMVKGKIPVYISAERRMACGIGACLGCAIETKSGMVRVCKEGPVFLGKEVVF